MGEKRVRRGFSVCSVCGRNERTIYTTHHVCEQEFLHLTRQRRSYAKRYTQTEFFRTLKFACVLFGAIGFLVATMRMVFWGPQPLDLLIGITTVFCANAVWDCATESKRQRGLDEFKKEYPEYEQMAEQLAK